MERIITDTRHAVGDSYCREIGCVLECFRGYLRNGFAVVGSGYGYRIKILCNACGNGVSAVGEGIISKSFRAFGRFVLFYFAHVKALTVAQSYYKIAVGVDLGARYRNAVRAVTAVRSVFAAQTFQPFGFRTRIAVCNGNLVSRLAVYAVTAVLSAFTLDFTGVKLVAVGKCENEIPVVVYYGFCHGSTVCAVLTLDTCEPFFVRKGSRSVALGKGDVSSVNLLERIGFGVIIIVRYGLTRRKNGQAQRAYHNDQKQSNKFFHNRSP